MRSVCLYHLRRKTHSCLDKRESEIDMVYENSFEASYVRLLVIILTLTVGSFKLHNERSAPSTTILQFVLTTAWVEFELTHCDL